MRTRNNKLYLAIRDYRVRFTVKHILIKLLFSKLLFMLSVNNPTHMYLSDLRVYFKVEVYFIVTRSRMEEY